MESCLWCSNILLMYSFAMLIEAALISGILFYLSVNSLKLFGTGWFCPLIFPWISELHWEVFRYLWLHLCFIDIFIFFCIKKEKVFFLFSLFRIHFALDEMFLTLFPPPRPLPHLKREVGNGLISSTNTSMTLFTHDLTSKSSLTYSEGHLLQ